MDLPRRGGTVVVMVRMMMVVVVLCVVVVMVWSHPAAAGQSLRAEVAAVGGVARVGVLAAGLQVAHLVREGLVHHVGRGAASPGPAAGR